MQTALMLLISALAGFVVAGLVWYGWAMLENIIFLRAQRRPAPAVPASEPPISAGSVAKAESPPTRK
ncbi:MAG: hypothetical protein HY706_21485 [Candidatus Hydrogenedentes bacterium]|nr:hypothetical protein [Candidatus Hydrogenedentota bacterium]